MMMSQLHERICAARKHAKLTQEHLAELLHVSKAAVAQWESKDSKQRTTPTPANLVRIQQETRVSMDWLMNDGSDLKCIITAEPLSSGFSASQESSKNILSPAATRLFNRLLQAEKNNPDTSDLFNAIDAILNLYQPILKVKPMLRLPPMESKEIYKKGRKQKEKSDAPDAVTADKNR